MKRLAILFALSYVVSAGVAQAATYYVSRTGSNSNSCGQAQSTSTPKLTIASGTGCLSAGDTLLVRAGRYPEGLTSAPSGTSWSAPVRIAAYPGEVVWMAPSSNAVINLTSEQYIEFDGINMDSSATSDNTVTLVGSAHHLRFQNAEIIGSPNAGGCASICGGTDSEFINLKIHGGGIGGGCGWACGSAGIYTGGDNNLIEGCDIYDVSTEGIQIYHGSIGAGSGQNNVIRNNRIHDITRTGYPEPGLRVGILVGSGSNNQVYNNLIYNIGSASVGSGTGIYVFSGGTTATKVWHNTVYANYYGINIDGGTNTVVQNNIIYGNSGASFLDSGSGTTRDHNLEGPDPLFVNAGGGDFNLRSGSPAVNVATGLSGVTKDFAGGARSQGGAPDIGAYELGGPAAPPAAPANLRIVAN